MKKRVVVTGMGVVSPIGCTVETFLNSLKQGVNGIDFISKFDGSVFATQMAGEVKDFDASSFIERKKLKRMDSFTQFALAASKMAVESSKIDTEKVDSNRFGVIISSGIGGMETYENQHKTFLERGPGRVSPFFIPMMIPNMAAGTVSIEFGAKGICECIVTACSSGNNAIGNAYRVIKNGYADVIICGGAEAPLTPLSFAGFCSLKAMSTSKDKNTASRPFDRERDGFVMSEGAGILVIEDYEHAVKRNAPIIAEIGGYWSTSDAFHMTAPAEDGNGGARSMEGAILDAGLKPEDIDYINAHGTSTPLNDKTETMAIKTVFGDHAYKVSISSTKSMTGHLLGAAGGIESIACCLALKEGYIPPTINYRNKDEECNLDYTVNEGKYKNISTALSNSLGFGGHNSTLVFKKIKK